MGEMEFKELDRRTLLLWEVKAKLNRLFGKFRPREKSNLEKWAKTELNLLLISCQDDPEGYDMQGEMNKHLLKMVQVFSDEGHSGGSASYALSMLRRLLSWTPILPLTGEDSEWEHAYNDDNGNEVEQNLRCLHVFRLNHDNTTAHDNEGKTFSDNGGKSYWHTKDSSVPVTFPYDVPLHPEKVILPDGALDEDE